jgi:transposase
MARTVSRPVDRVAERRCAAALARHYRDSEQLSIADIARRLGRAPATVKAYLYDPTGEKARAVKGALPRLLPHLRRRHQPTQRQARRLPILPALPPRRGHTEMDARARVRGDAPLGRALRPRAVVV